MALVGTNSLPKMKVDGLKIYPLIYLGTPYAKYPGGIEAAFKDACKLTADLLRAGLKVYSPIAHTHPIAIHGGLDPKDNDIWIPFDKAIMDKADAMIVAMMPSWEVSKGIEKEVQHFIEASKPVYYLDPEMMQVLA